VTDGKNESIQFTRGDAERLAVVERDVCHVKKMVNRVLRIMYGGAFLIVAKEIYFRVNGG
jgi:hypothetical protein